MDNVETLQAETNYYVSEILAIICFAFGFWMFNKWRFTTPFRYNVSVDFHDLIRASLSEGHLERAFVYLEE